MPSPSTIKYFEPFFGPVKVTQKQASPSSDPKLDPSLVSSSASAPALSTEDEVIALLTQNAGMSAPTLFNLLKSKGFKFVKDVAPQEADSASSFPQALIPVVPVPKKKGKSKKNSTERNLVSKFHFETHLKESDISPPSLPKNELVGFTAFDVVLLQEGMGNFKDAFYYSKGALESAVPVFTGAKIFADHPSKIDEETLPERSVRDILGHFENVRVEAKESGPAQLCGTVRILPQATFDWARGLMYHAVEFAKQFPDKEFCGLSINANGQADPMDIDQLLSDSSLSDQIKLKLNEAKNIGISQVNVVSKIDSAMSCDLVTSAGAGGKVRALLESNKEIAMPDKKEEQKEALPAKPEDGKPAEKPEGPEHADANQDMELIKKMLNEYMGEGAYGEAEMKMAHESLEMAKKEGMNEEEAMKCAGYGMKMASMVQKAKEAMPVEGDEPKEAGAVKESEVPEAKCDDKKSPDQLKNGGEKISPIQKESAELIQLRGELTALKESNRKRELSDYLDKKLSGLKESRSVTDEIRKAVGVLRSKEQIDQAVSLFNLGFKTKESDDKATSESWFTESLPVESVKNELTSDVLSLADCVK